MVADNVVQLAADILEIRIQVQSLHADFGAHKGVGVVRVLSLPGSGIEKHAENFKGRIIGRRPFLQESFLILYIGKIW